MKIVKIETFKHYVRFKNWLFVRVETDEGIHGWGEASLAGAIEAVEKCVHELGANLIGQDPSGVERHWQALYQTWRWRGGPIQTTAHAGLDMALWDIEGKRLGVPVYRLLGGPHRDKIRTYASHWLRGAETPEEAYEGAKEAVRRGFTAFKWNPFQAQRLRENENRAISHAAEMMAAARDGAGPDVDIFVDVGERFSQRTAIAAATALAPYRLSWMEEPLPFENPKAMAKLRESLPVPLATGERLLSRWEFRELIEEQGADIIQPDISHAGGISEVRRIAQMADIYYTPVAPHNSAGPIGTFAALHLMAATPNFYILEQMEVERELRDSLCTNPLVFNNGYFELPTAPGLGTDLKLDVLADYPFQPVPVRASTESHWH